MPTDIQVARFAVQYIRARIPFARATCNGEPRRWISTSFHYTGPEVVQQACNSLIDQIWQGRLACFYRDKYVSGWWQYNSLWVSVVNIGGVITIQILGSK